MQTCNNSCIANVGGQCAVENCGGAMVGFDMKKAASPEEAANRYDLLSRIFDAEFKEQDD